MTADATPTTSDPALLASDDETLAGGDTTADGTATAGDSLATTNTAGATTLATDGTGGDLPTADPVLSTWAPNLWTPTDDVLAGATVSETGDALLDPAGALAGPALDVVL